MLQLHRGFSRPATPCFASTSLHGIPVVAPLGWHRGGRSAAIDEEAYLKAQDLAHDQTHGRTGWETECDR